MFKNCTSLEEIYIPENVQALIGQLGNYMFQNCTSLKSFKIPAATSLFAIGQSTFEGCTALEEVEVGSLSETAPNVFKGCSSLRSFVVTSGNVMYVLNSNVFEGCTSMMEFHFYPNSGVVLANAFLGWTEEQTLYFHGFANLEEVMSKFGTALENCNATIVVLPE
jgi:hypothetical protein